MSDGQLDDFTAWEQEVDPTLGELSAWEIVCATQATPDLEWWVDESLSRAYLPDDGLVRLVLVGTTVEPAPGFRQIAGLRIVNDRDETLLMGYRTGWGGLCMLTGFVLGKGQQLRVEVLGSRIAAATDHALKAVIPRVP